MNFKRFVAVFMTVVLCVLMLPVHTFAAEVANGTCGKNLTWRLDDSGTLTISGTGTMKDYILGSPWADYRDSIVNVVIEEGVTTIGVSAFQSHKNLISVTLPDTLKTIEDCAFAFCEKLSSVAIPASVKKIGVEAFASCYGLQGVYITDLSAWMNIQFEGGKYLYNPECANPLYWGKENKLYLNGELLTEVTIPDGITEIGPAVLSSHALEKVIIPDGVTKIGDFAFSSCTSLTDVTIANSVTSIGEKAFQDCSALERITFPDSITSIGEYAFFTCDKLSEITIPGSVITIGRSAFCQCDTLTNVTISAGVTSIPDSAFYGCDKLASITIPSSVTGIGKNAFIMCYALKDVYFDGTAGQWEELLKNVDPSNADLLGAKIHIAGNPLIVYSDANNLNVEIGKTITLSAGIWVDNETMGDPSGITFQLADGYAVKVLDTGIEKGCFYLQLQGVMEGNTYVTFTDSGTGKAVTVPVTVSGTNPSVFTLESVPEFEVYNGVFMEGPVNIYNKNGLYVDSFRANMTDNGKAFVSFDVYNTNHTYAIVEVYDENGNLYSAALIDKVSYLNDGIKKVLWDGTGCFVRDMVSGNALTYKQETNFSKRTPVEVEIPKNGYIRITANSMESDILAIVNAADIVVASYSLAKDAGNLNRLNFAEDLTEQLALEDYMITSSIDEKMAKEVLKGCHKEVFLNSKNVGDFASTLYNNLQDLNLWDLIMKSADNTAVGVVEEELKAVLGVYGDALDWVFAIGKAENLACQYMSLTRTENGGVIIIQNQGGGKRHCDNIVLESKVDFDPEVALQVYSVTLDEALLEKIKNADMETYEILTKSIMHTYDIALVKNDEGTQHSSDVAVYIPIPHDLEYLALSGHVKVFRVEEDGTLTDMDAVVQGDTVMFTTDHFSLYTLVGYEAEEKPEDPVDPSDPTTPATRPSVPATEGAEKDEPSDSKSDTPQPSNNGSVVVVIVIVLVVLVAGAGAAFAIVKKKKQS